MPTFTFYSIGDSAFLEQILIGVAMLTGTGDLKSAVGIGMLLGVITMMVQSLIQGAKQINFQQTLVCWVGYMIFFGPSCIVTIEDAYNGRVRVVANVPIGVGFTGGVISNVGYKITSLFETGFGVILPQVTKTEFAEALKLLNNARRNTNSSHIYATMNSIMGGGYIDSRKSIENYIKECTLTKIDLGLMSADQLMTSSLNDAIRFESELYGTKVYTRSGEANGLDITCGQAFHEINTILDSVGSVDVQAAIGTAIGDGAQRAGNGFSVQSALSSLSQFNTTASDYLRTALVEPLYFDAVSGKYTDQFDYGSALMVNQAIQQRNTQWAAEQSLFLTVARPMMAFFEGFVYAITPIMAIVMVLGSSGLQMIGKYFQTILWIQLWMPVLAVINLYIHTVSSERLAEMVLYTPSGKLDSFYALNGAGEILQNWIATGGMLAAATPMISLFIVTGSTYAFTSLAGRLNGGDHINEKMTTPDVLQGGALMQMMPMHSGNSYSGSQLSGTENLLSQMNFGSTLSDGISSASNLQKSTSEAFKSEIARGVTEGTNSQQQFQRLQSLGRTISSTGTEQSQFIDSQAKDIGKQFSLNDSQIEAVKGALGLAAMGSLNAGNTGALAASLGAGISAKADKTTDIASGAKFDQVMKAVQGVNFSTSSSQALTNSLAHTASDTSTKSFASTWGDQSSNSIAKTAQQAVTATESLSNLQSMQQSLGSATQTDMKTLAGAITRSPEAERQLHDAVLNASPAVRKEAAELENRYSKGYGMDANIARNAANLTALTNASNYSGGNNTSGLTKALRAIGTATGQNLNYTGEANRNEGLKKEAPPAVDTNKINEGLSKHPVIDDGKRAQVKSESSKGVGGPGSVYADNNAGTAKVARKGSDGLKRVEKEQGDIISDYVAEQAKKLPQISAAETMSTIEEIGNRKDTSGRIIKEGDRMMANATPDDAKRIQAEYDAQPAWQKAVGWIGNALLGAQAESANEDAAMLGKAPVLSPAFQGMTTEAKGYFVAKTLSDSATNLITGSATHSSEAIKETAESAVKNHKFTPIQAEMFAHARHGNIDGLNSAALRYREQYAEKTSDGQIKRDSSGVAIVSQDNENKMRSEIAVITQAGRNGGEYATGGMALGITAGNTMAGSKPAETHQTPPALAPAPQQTNPIEKNPLKSR